MYQIRIQDKCILRSSHVSASPFCLRLVLCSPLKPYGNSGRAACAMQQLHLIARETVANPTLAHIMCVCKEAERVNVCSCRRSSVSWQHREQLS